MVTMVLSTHSIKEVSAVLRAMGIKHRCHNKDLLINIYGELSDSTKEAIRDMRNAIEWAVEAVAADRETSDDPATASHSRD